MWTFLCLGLLSFYFNCEKDDTFLKEKQSSVLPEAQIMPNIKTVSFYEVGEKFNRLKNQFQLEGFLNSSLESNILSRSSIDTLGVTIYIDVIKEITIDDYTSYTMLIVLPESDGTKFYNLTIEDKNGVEGMFMTKYTPTENWLNDKNQTYEGGISTKRIEAITHEFPPDGGGEIETGGYNNPYEDYPHDCDGYVETSVVYIPVPCECPGRHPPGGCNPIDPCSVQGYWVLDTTYYCFPYDSGVPDNGEPSAGITGPGGQDDSPVNDSNDGSFTTIIDESTPEQCENPPPGDLNGDCVIDDYEQCLLDGNSLEICHCVVNGGSLEECEEDCKKLKHSISDHPIIKTRLNQLRLDGGNYEKGFRVNKRPTNNEYEPSPILDNSGSNHINIPVYGYTTVVAHNHPSFVFYKMFSAPDILKMAQIAKKIQNTSDSTVQLTEITHILVFENSPGDFRTFALRFDNVASVQTLLGILNDAERRTQFQDDLKELYESDHNYQTALPETTISKQQGHLFKLLDKLNLSISLYEANFDNNNLVDNWQKINKDTLEKEPCD